MKRFGGKLAQLLMISLTLLFSTPLFADDQPAKIEILSLNDYQQDQQLLLDGMIKIQLSKTLLDALHHEILLIFNTKIELIDQLNYLGIPYHQTIKNIEFETTLQYLTYNQTYYITNKRNNQVQAFSNLHDALTTLGTLSHFYLVDLSELYSHNRYLVQVRSQLERWQLPAPLILDSLFDPDWHLDSGWQKLNIHNGTENEP